jgi:Xaa-Pro dipeptidase
MHKEQRDQTHALLKQHNIHQAIFSKPASVCWLTGFAPPVQVGPNLFTASYPLLWYDDGQFTLIVVESYADLAEPFSMQPDCAVLTYEGYTPDAPIASATHLLDAFTTLLANTQSKQIGIESAYTSDMIAGIMRNKVHEMIAIDGWLEPLRMVKTEEELVKLRRNFKLTDIGHAVARQATQVGKREIDVWNALHSAVQDAAGCRVPVGNDCVVGRREQNIGGWPRDWELLPNDSLIVDLSVVLDGYWSDSCGTYYVQERTAEQEKIHRIVTDALEYGISLVRPGAVAKDIDQKVRQFIIDRGYPAYPHHTGHGVGVSGHELPRIAPYSDEILQSGMIIMLEPGIYFPGQLGVRLEDAVLVTSNGGEVLTQFDKS